MVGSGSTALNEMTDKLRGFDDKTFGAFRRAISRAESLENAVDTEAEEEEIIINIKINNGHYCGHFWVPKNADGSIISAEAKKVIIPFLNGREIKREVYFPSGGYINFIVG